MKILLYFAIGLLSLSFVSCNKNDNQNEITESQRQIAKLEKESAEWKEEKAVLQKKIADLEKQDAELSKNDNQNEIAESKRQIAESKRQIAESQRQIAELETQMAEIAKAAQLKEYSIECDCFYYDKDDVQRLYGKVKISSYNNNLYEYEAEDLCEELVEKKYGRVAIFDPFIEDCVEIY